MNSGYCSYCGVGIGYERTGVCGLCEVRLETEVQSGIQAIESFLLDAAPESLGAADSPYDWDKWFQEEDLA